MTLDLKKKLLERKKVDCARDEMEMRIFEAEENIERLRYNIDNQSQRLSELDEEIAILQGEK